MQIKFLKNNEIDKQRWDECVKAASHGLIYARAFYLDIVCPGWSALTGEDYGWILPVTHKTKWGVSYLYQPHFTQQLGIFFKSGISVPSEEIIAWLQQRYKFWEINWNFATDTNIVSSLVQLTAATNFVLDLRNSAENIASGYHNVLAKNLRLSKRFNLIYRETNDFDTYINLYRKQYGNRFAGVKDADYSRFSKICNYAFQNNMIQCRQVLNNKGELLAAIVMLCDGRRLYNIINVITESGRKKAANHFLLHSVIAEFAGRELLFDFEGSDVPGVKTFYEYFRAVNQPFYQIKYNKLRWPIYLFKQ